MLHFQSLRSPRNLPEAQLVGNIQERGPWNMSLSLARDLPVLPESHHGSLFSGFECGKPMKDVKPC